MSFRLGYLLLATFLLNSASVLADDWPQWLGENRDSVWKEEGVLTEFPQAGPKILWRQEIGLGYAGPAVAGGRVFVADYLLKDGDLRPSPSSRNKLEGKERVLCLDAKTGKEIWKHEYDRTYDISYPSGPRCTPTVADGKVYSYGAEGDLFCLSAEDGEVVWHVNMKDAYKADTPLWGFASHPLVHGDMVYVTVGGEGSVVVALDKATGKEVWTALSAKEPGYCPASIIQQGGVEQLIIWHAEAINGLNPKTGEVYWTVPLAPAYSMAIATPKKSGDFLFATGMGEVAALLKLASDKPTAEVAWRGKIREAVYCSNSTPLVTEDTIYGVDSKSGGLIAANLKTGERLWEVFEPTTGERRAGHGTAFLVQNGDHTYLMSETGDLVIAKLSRDGYKELSRAHIIDPTGDAFGRAVVWSHPAFANKCCFARNDKEIVCVDLAE